MPRRYDTGDYQKHKTPGGWGSLCPHPAPADLDPQALLDGAVLVERVAYNVQDDQAYCAREHLPEVWHGYPIPWDQLPVEAVTGLVERGRLTMARYRKGLRRNWGGEGKR